MKHLYTTFFAALLLPAVLWAQQATPLAIEKVGTVNPRDYKLGYEAQIQNLEAPAPGGNSFRGHLRELRKEVRKANPVKLGGSPKQGKTQVAPVPVVVNGFTKLRRFPSGLVTPLTGGIPNDNTMAISKDGILLSAINSVLWAYDTKTDSMLFPVTILSLQFMASGFASENYYDPKLLYDKDADRFILTWLGNNRPENSKVMMAFSSTNNPVDPWYVYTIPGNPLQNNRWTDFPAIAVTDDELFYTGNLIIPNVSWQLGFDGSVIWQIDKKAGFAGAATLPTKLWSDVRFDGRFTRNLFPVTGADGAASEIYFLSNRNFDIANDTIFVVKLRGKITDPNATLEVVATTSNTPYGLAPNGRQSNTNLADPTSGLDVNDARVLGGFLLDGTIQFVSTTVNPATGLAAIYHGFIQQPEDSLPIVTANIIGDDSLDLAYPNIAWTGKEYCQGQAIIGLNYTSPEVFAGTGAVFFGNDSSYAPLLRLKDGENYISRLAGTYDRWGDYYGIQRKYDEPGKVYLAGFYALPTRVSATWLATLVSADTLPLAVTISQSGNASACKASLTANATGGNAPYQFDWLAPESRSGSTIQNLCRDTRAIVRVTDASGCVAFDTALVKFEALPDAPLAYPSPFTEYVNVQFTIPSNGTVTARLYNLQGQYVDEIIRTNVQVGLNELSFFTNQLAAGTYLLVLTMNEREIFSQKIIKM